MNNGQTTFNLEKPLDKGYAWVILFACSSIYIVLSGMAKAFGILYTELIKEFQTGAGNTAWIGSVMMFLFFGLGPIANYLAELFTFRKVIMLGGFLTSLGYFVSAFVPRMEWMYLTIGVITGTGCGLVFAPGTTIISFYFEKRRALALGVVLAGAGIGSVMYPYFYKVILERYGLRTSMMIVSGVLLYVPLAGLLLKEPHQLQQRKNKSLEQLGNTTTTNQADDNMHRVPEAKHYIENIIVTDETGSKDIKTNKHIVITNYLTQGDKNNVNMVTVRQKTDKNCETTQTREKTLVKCVLFDFSLFRIPRFTMYVLSFSVNILGYAGNFTAFPCYIGDLGYGKDNIAIAMSIIGATEVIARPFFGWFADLKLLSVKTILIFSAVVSGIAAIVFPLFDSYSAIILYSVLVGAFPGAFWSLMAVAMLECVGLDLLSRAMGLLSMFMAIGMVLSQPVAGWLKDATGSWDLSFRIIGMFVSLAGLFVIAEPLFNYVWARNLNNMRNGTDKTRLPEIQTDKINTEIQITVDQNNAEQSSTQTEEIYIISNNVTHL